MRHQRLNYVVVGVFTLAMLVAGIGSIIMLSGRAGETDAYHLVLDNVADVKFGTQVRYEGYPIGQVEQVVPFVDQGRMRFRVDVAIERGWRVAKDAVARIGSSSLLSAKTIDIARGTDAEAETLAPGDEIASAPPIDVFTIVSGLAEEFGDLSRDGVKPLIADIGRMTRALGETFQADLSRLMGSLNVTAEAVEKRAETVAARMDSITAALDRVMSDENVEAVGRVVANVERTSENFAATTRKLELTRQQVDKLIRDVDGIVQDNRGTVDKSLTNLQYTLRSIARTIDSVMFNIDSSGRNMSEFTRMIRQNPGLLLGGGRREAISPASRADRGRLR